MQLKNIYTLEDLISKYSYLKTDLTFIKVKFDGFRIHLYFDNSTIFANKTWKEIKNLKLKLLSPNNAVFIKNEIIDAEFKKQKYYQKFVKLVK